MRRTAPIEFSDTTRSRHEYVSRSWLSIAAGISGLEESAFRWAERAVTERDPIAIWCRRLPFWDSLRGHTRFEETMRQVWE